MTMMMIVEHMIYDMNMIVVFTNPGHLIVADILDLACERDIASNPEDVNIQEGVKDVHKRHHICHDRMC